MKHLDIVKRDLLDHYVKFVIIMVKYGNTNMEKLELIRVKDVLILN